MTEITPIVIEFTSSNFPFKNAKHYYIGKSEEDILEATNKGKYDYLAEYSFYRKIPLQKAEQLNLGFYKEGYKSILNGAKAFKLKTPEIEFKQKI